MTPHLAVCKKCKRFDYKKAKGKGIAIAYCDVTGSDSDPREKNAKWEYTQPWLEPIFEFNGKGHYLRGSIPSNCAYALEHTVANES